MRTFAGLVIRFRLAVLISIGLITLFFIYVQRDLAIQYVDIFPPDHASTQLQRFMVETFGGTAAVLVAMEVKEGEIFEPKNLDKLNRVQTAVKNIRGVVPFRIYSIVSPKFARVDAGFDEFGVPEIKAEGFEELYAQIAGGDQAAMQRHRTAIVEDADLFGSVVSRDLKGTVLIANFWSEKDYPTIYQALREIVAAEEDENTRFYLAGRPILLGEIDKQLGRISLLFGLAVLAMVSLLYIDFHLVRAILLALSAGILADIWGMGVATFLGFKMDVLAMTVPFMILAISHGHSVQMLARFFLEAERLHDPSKAAEEALAGLMRPALAAVVCGAAGFLTLTLLPFPALTSMAVVATAGIPAIFVTTFIYIPTLSSYLPLPPPGAHAKRERDAIGNFFAWVATRIVDHGAWWQISLASAAIFVVSLIGALTLKVGELGKGSPYFWQNSTYNVAEQVLNEKFTGSNDMWIYVRAQGTEAVLDPVYMNDVYQLQARLLERDDVRYARSYMNFLRKASIAWHEMNPKWELVPTSSAGGQDTFRMLGARAGGSADDIKDLVEQGMQEVTLTVFLKDHQPETIASVLTEARSFVEKYKRHPSIEFGIAAGSIGLYGGINEIIGASQLTNIWHMYAIDCLVTAGAFFSPIAALLVLPPITLGLLITYGVMGFLQVGVFIYTLPIAALGLGVGIDYSFYVMSYLKEGLDRENDPAAQRQIFIDRLRFVGRAVFFTGMTVAAAVTVLFLSPLRFQAMMGILLAFIMMTNMVGGGLLFPALLWRFKPRFVFGRTEKIRVEKAA